MLVLVVVLLWLLPLAQPQPSIVLTIDTSVSMEKESRLDVLVVTLFNWIAEIPEDVLVGMVAFNTEEEILNDLTTSKEQLKKNLPTDCDGDTCIGCGVRAALEILGDKASLGVIVLITDGENTEPGGYINDILQDVVASGATVVTVGIGDEAPVEGLKELSAATGGQFFQVNSNSQQELSEALNLAVRIAQYVVNPTTPSQRSTAESVSYEIRSTNASASHVSKHPMDIGLTTKDEKPHVTPFWLIVAATIAAGLVAVLLVAVVIMLVWRQLFVPQNNGFYQIAYSTREYKT